MDEVENVTVEEQGEKTAYMARSVRRTLSMRLLRRTLLLLQNYFSKLLLQVSQFLL
jgi:hypothetical protein